VFSFPLILGAIRLGRSTATAPLPGSVRGGVGGPWPATHRTIWDIHAERRSETPDLATVRQRLKGEPDLPRLGPEAVLYAVLDAVVDGYAPVGAGLRNDIEEIETEVFGRDPSASRRIYALSREVVEFQRAARPDSQTPRLALTLVPLTGSSGASARPRVPRGRS
jgi:hypothetical protein